MISTLMFATLIAAALIGAFVLIKFLRKPGNRHPMEGVRERNIGEIQRGDPPAT